METPAPYGTEHEPGPTTPDRALYAALAKAQAAFLPIEKNREANIRAREGRASYAYRYADLAAIRAATKDALATNGLAIRTGFQDDGRACTITCLLTHEAGGFERSVMVVQSAMSFQDVKQFGALTSYLRRYMVTNMLGVAADDDLDDADDEDALRGPTGFEDATPMPRSRSDNTAGAATDEAPCTTGEIAFIRRKLEQAGITVEQAFIAAKLPAPQGDDPLAKLTKGQFAALKGSL